MKQYVIIADGASDISEELQKKYDIKTCLGYLHFPGNEDVRQLLSWKDVDRVDFYNKLKKKPNGYSASPPGPECYAEAFKEYISRGYDILVMTMSSFMSGSYSFAAKGREQALEEYPDADIRLIDCLRFGPGYGLLVIKASMLRKEGKTLDETAQWVEENKCRYHQAGWLDDLSFFAKKGRINHTAALMETLISIKPIGEFDYNGMTTVIGKARGAKKAYGVLLKYIAATIENPQEQMILIAQSNRLPQAEKFKSMIEEVIRPKEVRIVDVFPASGISIGPGLMAACYMGKPISEALTEEKELIRKFLNAAE